jgi:hypothetical protein
VKRPDSVAAAADPVSLRKFRRDNADMLAFPLNMFSYARMMRRVLAFRKPPANQRRRICAEIETLGCERIIHEKAGGAILERTF